MRAFVRNVEGTGKQELNQSPLPFIESASQPGARPLHAPCTQVTAIADSVQAPLRGLVQGSSSSATLQGSMKKSSRNVLWHVSRTGAACVDTVTS